MTTGTEDHVPDPLQRVLEELRKLHGEVRRDRDDLWEAIDDLHGTLEGREVERKDGRLSPTAYRRVRRRLRRMVEAEVPAGSVVAVVSRGDPDLLDLPDRETLHYPLSVEGHYLGYYPPDGTPAIAHLEWVRARGAEYLLLPLTAGWWLESFPAFTAHLERTATLVAEQDDVGRLYDLTFTAPNSDGARLVAGLVGAWERATDEAPSVLDWSTGLELAGRLPERAVFSPPTDSPVLPYLDGTVDIVVLSGVEPARLAEAERVACRSVVRGVGPSDDDREYVVAHIDAGPPPPASASVVIPTWNGIDHLRPCLRALQRTLGSGFVGEVIVVDDASDAPTAGFLQEHAEKTDWLRIVRNEENLGFIGSCNRGAAEADGDILVFLNDDTVPLEGWLDALLQVFERHGDAGAAGGRLVYPDGRLQEAGGVVFRDGSGANVGRGEWDPDAPMFTYVRPVDYCSGALLATPRHLFRDLGGFDVRYRPAYYEDTDYCFRVREAGRTVYYQPTSTVVHVEGASSGTDLRTGVKRHQVRNRTTFRKRWRRALRTRPVPPTSWDDATWLELVRGGGR